MSFIVFINQAFSESIYKFELNGNFTENTVLLSDKSTFSSLKSFGAFSDNQGNIGKYQCNGIREATSKGKLIDINVLCEVTDKGLDKIWMKAKRITDKSGGKYKLTNYSLSRLKRLIYILAVKTINKFIFIAHH